MDARPVLQSIFGFERFRPGQERAVTAALEGRDALVVMPTGSGKSLCYQLPALMGEDLTIVVSPLVSLMQDQVQALERIAPGEVEVVNAQRAGARNAEAVARAVRGEARLIYVAPERFAAPRFLDALAQARVGLFVVDEAHCVSQWGHDFRPDYFTLATAARSLGARATFALTATATPRVADDIVRRLELRDPVRVKTGFDRPNLSLAIVACATPADKRARLVTALAEPGALPAIVYAGTRSSSEELAGELQRGLGEEVLAYHAGLARGVRARAQERFMGGEVRVIVATNAFGMGIDKADVRTVAHASVPGSLEAYYQEAGRAGRDGAPARAVLFAEQRDKGLHVFFIQRAQIADDVLERVAERVLWAGLDGFYDLRIAELSDVARDGEVARSIIGLLARAGLLLPAPSAPDRLAGRIVGGWDARARAHCRAFAHEAERVRWAQYRSIWEYAEGRCCRRRTLLAHFGDHPGGTGKLPCCDVCDPGSAPVAPATPATAGASARPRPRPTALVPAPGGELDTAILEVVGTAQPSVGRTRAVEILRGGRSKLIAENKYNALAAYGSFAHLRTEDVLGRVDLLLAEGSLRSTGGRFPKLRAA
ncbi:MAG: RecQ family ATP-dependent DNA helicase [Solirubrobacteraceae bacterium]